MSAQGSSAPVTPEGKSPHTPPPPLPFYKNIIAGGIAGVSEILIMYPLDVIKTRAQLNTGANQNMFSALANLIKTDGIKCYRGIMSPILVEAPKRAVKFASNDAYRRMFADKAGKVSQAGSIAAGVCAGLTEAVIVVPFELVKIRLQAKENAGLYKNTMDCTVKIIQQEGPLALYRGLESTLWRHALWNGGYFGIINYLKSIIPAAESKSGNLGRDFVTGALAGTFGTMLNTPADVVKTRIQNYRAVPGQLPKYNWTLPAMATIAREEGVAALWKGFVPKVMRLGPGGGILLVVFNFISELLR